MKNTTHQYVKFYIGRDGKLRQIYFQKRTKKAFFDEQTYTQEYVPIEATDEPRYIVRRVQVSNVRTMAHAMSLVRYVHSPKQAKQCIDKIISHATKPSPETLTPSILKQLAWASGNVRGAFLIQYQELYPEDISRVLDELQSLQ